MSKEKQIEEMAECCPYFWNGACTVDAAKPTDCDLMCEMFGFMTNLVNAGYRKQSEGEWVKYPHNSGIYCSLCKHKRRYRDIRDAYCPNCGAKMKGANNE